MDLKDLADVQAGYPFRGSVPLITGGNAFALQMRDIAPDGHIDWNAVIPTHIDSGRAPQWLQAGDVLFVARGSRNYAVCLQEVPRPTVCSQYFFLLRIKSPALLPEFLAWQINRAPAQRYLASNAEGSDQLSIRRAVLEALPIAAPPLHRQQLLVALAEAAVDEKRKLEAMVRNRQHQLDALASELFPNDSLSAPKR